MAVHSEAADEASHDTLHHRHVDRRRDHHGDTHRDTLIFNWFTADHPKLSYRSLDYEVAVQPNGDLKVTQHIDMKLDSRGKNKPWKQLY